MSTLGRIPARLRQSATVATLCAGLMLTSLATGVSFADTNSAIDKLLGEATTQAQTMVGLMTNNCPGGSNGRPPQNYDAFVKRSNEVTKQLVDLRVALAKGKTPNAAQQIDSAKDGLEKMVAMMNQNCSGGAHGINPLNYGILIQVKENVSGKLDAVKTILEA